MLKKKIKCSSPRALQFKIQERNFSHFNREADSHTQKQEQSLIFCTNAQVTFIPRCRHWNYTPKENRHLRYLGALLTGLDILSIPISSRLPASGLNTKSSFKCKISICMGQFVPRCVVPFNNAEQRSISHKAQITPISKGCLQN